MLDSVHGWVDKLSFWRCSYGMKALSTDIEHMKKDYRQA